MRLCDDAVLTFSAGVGGDMRVGGSKILNAIEVQPTESVRIDLSISPNELV